MSPAGPGIGGLGGRGTPGAAILIYLYLGGTTKGRSNKLGMFLGEDNFFLEWFLFLFLLVPLGQ